MTDTPILALTELESSQAIPEVVVNENTRWLEFFAAGARVLDRGENDPPGSPADGDAYLIAATATGAWAGKEGQIALRISTAWAFKEAVAGMIIYVDDEDVGIRYDGAAWTDISGSAPIPTAFSLGTGFEETPTASYVIARYTFVEDIDFANDFAGFEGNIDTNPTSSFVMDVAVNGTPVGTVTISTGGAFTPVTTGGALSCLIGDELLVTAPATPDATAAGASMTWIGARP
jgi:hypothetical protein